MNTKQHTTPDLAALDKLCENCKIAQDSQPDEQIQAMMRSVCDSCMRVKSGLSVLVEHQQRSHELTESLVRKTA